MAPDRVIVTGSTGFVGRSLAVLLGRPFEALRFGAEEWRTDLEATDFTRATVIHLAGRAHQAASRDEMQSDNVGKTRALAQKAAAGGASRLVFLSSIKVNGEETRARPFTPEDMPSPEDEYGHSKWAAEQAIAAAAAGSPLECTIVRAPLVYGAGVAGNLLALVRLADSALPLPFAAIDNRRSFLHVDDLARLLLACAAAPRAAGRVYLAAHRAPVSTARLVGLMREKLGRPGRLFSVPAPMLEAAAALAGQSRRMRRLTRSLEVDPARAERELQWTAQVSLEAAVDDMVAAYRAEAA